MHVPLVVLRIRYIANLVTDTCAPIHVLTASSLGPLIVCLCIDLQYVPSCYFLIICDRT